MAPTDPHQGSDLFDMAKDGTSIPNDAGKQNTIPSVPRPDQVNDPNDLGAGNLAAAADNPTDIPRTHRDRGPTDSVLTGAGDVLPAEVQTKNLHFSGNALDKGHQRYDKHTKDKESHLEKRASKGPGMEGDEDVEVGSGEGREGKEG
ncbi:hypothetical protein MMC30_000874 [Trapelia coarctata]|nr:hypothetical protein [Trapelia coarctata]